MRRFSIAVLVSFLSLAAFAAGTVSFDQVRFVLMQNPDIGGPVVNAYDFQTTGIATRLGAHYGKLAGARVGPYDFRARPKGSKGDYNVAVRICTTLTFLDSGGNLLKKKHDAAKVRETLQWVAVRRNGADAPPCE